MAVTLIEGWDNTFISLKDWTSFGSAAPSFQTGRLGGLCAAMTASNQTSGVVKNVPAASTCVTGFAFKWANTQNMDNLFYQANAGTVVIRMDIQSMKLRFRNSGGTLLATGITTLQAGIWYYVEIKTVVHASTGSIEVRLNGVAEVSATGLNTGSTNVATLYWQTTNIGGAGSSTQWSIDDIYHLDTTGSSPTTDFLGDCRVQTLAPSGDGAEIAWTASAGNRWACIDEAAHNSDTDYISDATPGDRSTFTTPDLTTGVTVFAVQTAIVARKDDSGARTISPIIRQGGVDYDGTTTPGLSTSYLGYFQLYDRLGPDGAAWTESIVNAAEWGVRVVA
jgi:hypothetical protein